MCASVKDGCSGQLEVARDWADIAQVHAVDDTVTAVSHWPIALEAVIAVVYVLIVW